MEVNIYMDGNSYSLCYKIGKKVFQKVKIQPQYCKTMKTKCIYKCMFTCMTYIDVHGTVYGCLAGKEVNYTQSTIKNNFTQ